MAVASLSVSENRERLKTPLTPDEILENFELLDDWDARYAYLVEFGESLEPMDEAVRVDENRVQGCMSQVWVSARRATSNGDLVVYQGDCDTAVIKGVLALLIKLLSGRTAADIASLDVDSLFKGLRLQEHLSPNRHFGIYAIVELMKAQAAALV